MNEIEPAPQPSWRRLAAMTGEGIVAAWVWLGVNESAPLRLTTGGWLTALAGFAAAGAAGAWWAARWPRFARWRPAIELAVAAGGLAAVNARAPHPFTAAQGAYAVLAVSLVVWGWRAWAARAARRGAAPVAEPWRVLAVGSAALLAVVPFFTNGLLGGTDARWYAFMLRDFIDQLRAGVFPVFVGQGEFAWNGAVHPFRSAPVFMHIAGAWDFLSLRTLNAPALQHLTVLTAALGGVWGLYAAAVALAPRRRGLAAAVAVLYATAPSWLGVLVCADAYMTFMAMAAMPAVLYGNARTLRDEEGRGYGWLAAGLALIWMCHPPVAMACTMTTALLQGGSFSLGRADWARWRAALGGAALFMALGAYYFYSMGELPKTPGALRADALQVVALALVVAGCGRAFLLGGSRWWLAAIPLGLGLARVASEPWLRWLLLVTLLTAASGALRLRWTAWPGRHACTVLALSLLAAAGLAHLWVGAGQPGANQPALAALAFNRAHIADQFRPVSAGLDTFANFQPGAGLWLVLLLPLLTLGRPRPLGAQLMFWITLALAATIVPIPGVSDFLVGYAPPGLAQIASFGMSIRMLPVLVGLLAITGMLWLAEVEPGRNRGSALALGAVLTFAVGWNLWQSTHFVRRARDVTESRTRTREKFLEENRVLDAFTYHLARTPDYQSHGTQSPWLQARVLDGAQVVRHGPDETAREMERRGYRELRLTARVDDSNPAWLNLTPGITVEPGERLLLRFEFDPQVRYEGTMVWSGAHSYREYALPSSGGELAFGTGPKASRVVFVGNTTDRPEHHRLSMTRGAGNTLAGRGEEFATVTISRFEPERAAVRLRSLLPYRAEATLTEPGFIETSRVWLPGYRARLDGLPVEAAASAQGLVMVASGAGPHRLELDYVGTRGLWVALVVSTLAWLGWLWGRARRIMVHAG